MSRKQKQQSPQKSLSAATPKTVAVTVVPDGSSVLGDRVVWDNDSAAECGTCGFIGKVAISSRRIRTARRTRRRWKR
jgi:hypothetical protein